LEKSFGPPASQCPQTLAVGDRPLQSADNAQVRNALTGKPYRKRDELFIAGREKGFKRGGQSALRRVIDPEEVGERTIGTIEVGSAPWAGTGADRIGAGPCKLLASFGKRSVRTPS
jgi:hypothetical protein